MSVDQRRAELSSPASWYKESVNLSRFTREDAEDAIRVETHTNVLCKH